ncbi:MAG: hypothetical protein ACKPGB_18530, partial [Dolichospermum sp.]
GIIAVALGYVISAYSISFITLLFIKKIVGIDMRIYLSKYATPLVSTFIMVFFIILIKILLNQISTLSYTTSLISGIVTGIITYPLSIWLIKPELMKKIVAMINSLSLRFKKI